MLNPVLPCSNMKLQGYVVVWIDKNSFLLQPQNNKEIMHTNDVHITFILKQRF